MAKIAGDPFFRNTSDGRRIDCIGLIDGCRWGMAGGAIAVRFWKIQLITRTIISLFWIRG